MATTPAQTSPSLFSPSPCQEPGCTEPADLECEDCGSEYCLEHLSAVGLCDSCTDAWLGVDPEPLRLPRPTTYREVRA